MRTLAALLFAGAITCWVTIPAAAGPPAPRHGSPLDGGPPGPRYGPPPVEVLGAEAERLGLDEKTREAIKTVVEDSRAHGDEIRSKVADAREEMRRLLTRPDVQEADVMHQADAIGALELEEHKNWLRAMLRIRALLTPEQRAELIKMREEMFTAVFDGARSACTSDIARLCPDAHADEETRACMRRHRDEVSPACRDAIAAEFAKRRGRPPR